MTATAVVTLHDAVVAQIETISGLAGDKVYNEGEVPRGSPLPYAVMGTWNDPEFAQRYHGQPGGRQTVQVKWWADDKRSALALYADGKAALDGVTLTLTGHRTIRSGLGLLTDFPEPNPEIGGHQAVSRYATDTLVA